MGADANGRDAWWPVAAARRAAARGVAVGATGSALREAWGAAKTASGAVGIPRRRTRGPASMLAAAVCERESVGGAVRAVDRAARWRIRAVGAEALRAAAPGPAVTALETGAAERASAREAGDADETCLLESSTQIKYALA